MSAPGQPADPSFAETAVVPRLASNFAERFAPGTILASRYRVVSCLGQGGMGEVFRADDLVLGQRVALKFLPDWARGNQNLLTRFFDEVRIARQISHENVCRVHDIGEAAGQPFLSMEYIDGEDLRSLLRRIGRLPADKALEFSRKLCAGLAAAHSRGVLHRDFKPGNIMIDARGEVHITDFGLAIVAEHVRGAETRHGTPYYMAPEQLEGREVTIQSDIYALGLVLYEMFTGKVPFHAHNETEMLQLRKESRPRHPSAFVGDLDPAIEQAILRCLEPDPTLRPASAVDVARSLPGGDPLAAALAAGETPSPDLVAASGSSEALRPALAASLLAAVVVLLATLCLVHPRVVILDQVPLDNPPDALAAKAREIAGSVGYPDRPADVASGFVRETSYLQHLAKGALTTDEWNRLLGVRPAPVTYWYRQSPSPIVPDTPDSQVTFEDPVATVPGTVRLVLDPDGTLRQFEAVPPQLHSSDPTPQGGPDWSALFTAARLDPKAFQPVEPQWNSLVASDARAAWTGVYPGRTDVPIRVEAASFRGKPVSFQIVYPWTVAHRAPGRRAGAVEWAIFATNIVVYAMFAAATLLARRNWTTRRDDRRGASRLAFVAGSTILIGWLFGAHHVAPSEEARVLYQGISAAVFYGFAVWICYLALEPWVRRHWPQSLTVWSRVLAGRWRDPAVGRDVLVGVLAALSFALLIFGYRALMVRPGEGRMTNTTVSYLMGLRPLIADVMNSLTLAILLSLTAFLGLCLLRAVLKNQWVAAAVTAIIPALSLSVGSPHVIAAFVYWTCICAVFVVGSMRVGLFAGAVAVFVFQLALGVTTGQFTAWYGQSSLVLVIVMTGLGVYGFRIAIGRGHAFGKRLIA